MKEETTKEILTEGIDSMLQGMSKIIIEGLEARMTNNSDYNKGLQDAINLIKTCLK